MDGPGDDHTKSSKSEKDKYPKISLIRGIENSDTNELFNKTDVDSQTSKTNLWLPKGKGEGV